MRLDREYIQQFIDVIYQENKTIVLTAPAGFGKLHVFIKPILEDLLASPKKCLVVTSMKVMVDNIQENYFNYIESLSEDRKDIHKIIENRSKTFLYFKNGSVIDYKIAKETRGLPINTYDIIFIDTFRDVFIQLRGDFKYLFEGNKKVIITEDSMTRMQNMRDYPTDDVKEMIKNYKPFYALNLDKPWDLTMEIRKLKLKKIHDTIRTKLL